MTQTPLSRRRFLQHAGLAAGATALGLPATTAWATGSAAWSNWSGNQQARPAAILYPGSEAELVRAVRSARGNIRAFGGGHSFSGVVPTDGTLISLEQMTGLVGHDPANLTATLTGGTRIAVAGELLHAIGQSLQNEPDINMQSLAGAISTATHGTGTRLGCLSAYVTQLKLVLADGSVVTCSKDKDGELFDAARVSMGSLGIISEITFRNMASYKLRDDTRVMSLGEARAYLEARKDIDRHIEFLAFPFGDKAIVKQMNITTEPDTPVQEELIDQNDAVRLAADLVKAAPFTKGMVQRLVGAFVSEGARVGPAHRIFPNVRAVPFNEMEYTVPADQGLACIEEVFATLRKHDVPVFFPLEFRYVAADDTWLSPFSGRAGASISVHQYARQDYQEVFRLVEPVLRRYAGRPHWGKLHTLGPKDLHALYPRFADWLKVRARVDPQGRFLNPYMRTLLGIPA